MGDYCNGLKLVIRGRITTGNGNNARVRLDLGPDVLYLLYKMSKNFFQTVQHQVQEVAPLACSISKRSPD